MRDTMTLDDYILTGFCVVDDQLSAPSTAAAWRSAKCPATCQ
jgi:hypothetical protein